MIEELDIVALTQDLPDIGLKAGDIGTVVMVHQGGMGYEVEFMTFNGETVALATLYPSQIRALGEHEMMHSRQIGAD